MNITFKGRIPISTTKVYDKLENKFKQATLYEIDGKDESDIEEFIKDKGAWHYKYNMMVGLVDKQRKMAQQQEPSFDNNTRLLNRFYLLENQDGSTGGFCQTASIGDFTNVLYLERNPDNRYGLVGQTMLASIAKQMLKRPDSMLFVDDPALRARDFYVKDCGFEEISPRSRELKMEHDKLKTFVEKVEERTESPIVDINC